MDIDEEELAHLRDNGKWDRVYQSPSSASHPQRQIGIYLWKKWNKSKTSPDNLIGCQAILSPWKATCLLCLFFKRPGDFEPSGYNTGGYVIPMLLLQPLTISIIWERLFVKIKGIRWTYDVPSLSLLLIPIPWHGSLLGILYLYSNNILPSWCYVVLPLPVQQGKWLYICLPSFSSFR